MAHETQTTEKAQENPRAPFHQQAAVPVSPDPLPPSHVATRSLGATPDARNGLQVESRLGDIDRIPGLTIAIVGETHLGKAVSKLAKLGNAHPSSGACEQVASKARSSHYLHNPLPLLPYRLDLFVAHRLSHGSRRT